MCFSMVYVISNRYSMICKRTSHSKTIIHAVKKKQNESIQSCCFLFSNVHIRRLSRPLSSSQYLRTTTRLLLLFFNALLIVFLLFSKVMTCDSFEVYLKTGEKSYIHRHCAFTGTLVLRLKFYKYTSSTIHDPIWSNWSINTFSAFSLYFSLFSTNTVRLIFNCQLSMFAFYLLFFSNLNTTDFVIGSPM